MKTINNLLYFGGTIVTTNINCMEKKNNKSALEKKNNKSTLEKIRCKYIFEKIIDNVKQKTKLNIFRFNKNLQTKSSLKLNDYKEFSCRFRLK